MKGINLRIEETKKQLTDFLNEKLQELPISILKLIVENSLNGINTLNDKVVEKEISDYEKEIQNGDNSKEAKNGLDIFK